MTSNPPLAGGPSDSASGADRSTLASPPGSGMSADFSLSSSSKSPPEASRPEIVHLPAMAAMSPRLVRARQTRS